MSERRDMKENSSANHSDRHLAALVRTAPVGIGLVLDRVLKDVNQHFCDMMGYTREELIGRGTRFLYPGEEEYEAVGREEYRQIRQTGSGSVETRLLRKDGSIIQVLLKSTPMAPGDPQQGVAFAALDITAIKETEEDLRLFKTITEKALHGAAITDLQGRLTFTNEVFARAHGFTVDEMLGMSVQELHAEDHLEHFGRTLDQMQSIGGFGPEEVMHRHRDGHDFPMLMTGFLITGDDGQPRCMTTTAIDISQMKEAEKQLHLHSLVLGQIRDQVTVTDLDGVITYVNEAQERVGFSRENLLGRSVHILGEDPVEGATQAEIIEKTMKRGHWRGEVINFDPDGRRLVMDCRTSIVRDESGAPIAMCGVSSDITRQKRVERELRESEIRFRTLHNASFGGICIHDRGLVLECNQGLADMTGYSVEDLVGMDGLNLIAEEDRDRVREKITSGTEEPYEAWGRRKDGEIFPMRVEARNIPYKGRQVRVVEFRDLTEIKKVEAEQERLHQQLIQAQKMEAVGQLAGGVAHDFNNLLQVIQGYGELAGELSEADPKLSAAVQQILKASTRARNLVSQLLSFSRRQILDLQVLDLNEAIAENLRLLRRVIGEHIELRFVPGNDLENLRADPGHIHQVLTNLCLNARDAMPDGGNITITTSMTQYSPETWEGAPEADPGPYLQILFEDQGHGMDEATRAQIFEPFFTTKEVGKGSGLGLSTVYGLVKQHDGFIFCDSEPGRGTRFHILFPPSLDLAAAPEAGMEKAPPSGSGTILMAEDDEMVRELNQAILERHGYEVVMARDGTEAREVFLAEPDRFDVALLDVVMPGISGRAVYDTIRSLRSDLPVVFTSGYSRGAVSTEFVEQTGLTFLQKPVSRDRLLRALAEALGS